MASMGSLTLVTFAIIAVLSISLVAVYVTTSNQVSNLNQSIKDVCNSNELLASSWFAFANNATKILNGQIQSDKIMINSLNSTKPSGYQSMITTINNQISQDNSVITSFASQVHINVSSPQSLCSNP